MTGEGETRRQVPERLGGARVPAARAVVGVLIGSCLAAGVALLGCVAMTSAPPPRAIIVSGPPPAPVVEERTPSPHAEAMWIAGYWHWTGIQYAWIPGHWEEAPPPGSTWRAPRYVSADGAYFYEPGTWSVAPLRANAFH